MKLKSKHIALNVVRSCEFYMEVETNVMRLTT